jgi:hypothetical protein
VAFNNAFVDIQDNLIEGGASCWYNNPPPYFKYNTVKGGTSGQCVATQVLG